MQAALPLSAAVPDRLSLPGVSATLWRASELGQQAAPVHATGWTGLDRALPGGGWPCQALTEVLVDEALAGEWRLLQPVLRQAAARQEAIVLIGPPQLPQAAGMAQGGLAPPQMVWIDAHSMADRLWAAEQLLQTPNSHVLAWLPQVRPEQLRRLQIHALRHEGLAFVVRPAAVRHEPSAAPLRVWVQPDACWSALQLHILKRRGVPADAALHLPACPPALQTMLPDHLPRRQAAVPSSPHPASRQPQAKRVAAPRMHHAA